MKRPRPTCSASGGGRRRSAPPSGADRLLRPLTQGLGRGLVLGMPVFLKALGAVGTAAMVWVGGGIIIHGLEEYGLAWLGHAVHGAAEAAASGPPRRFRGRRVARHRGGVGHRRPRGRGRAHPPRGARAGAGLEAASRNCRRWGAAAGLLTRTGRTVARR